jgi:hypothetical protein
MDLISKAANWPFLNEPIYRWGIFFLAVGAMGMAWNGVVDIMREAG